MEVPFSIPYLDTLTHSATFNDHLSHINRTFDCYRKANMQLRREKCFFGYTEMEFVGHVVSKEGICPVPSLIDRIKQQGRPSNARELKSFLGLINYYRNFIQDFARWVASLYELTGKNVQISWNERCESGFSELCNMLSSHSVILTFPKWDQPFIFEVGASNQAIGGVLTQLDGLGVRRPLAYFSWAIVVAARKEETTSSRSEGVFLVRS